tara:strand:- start:3828 stop:5468 length:1641 start_codon:yes stop_codon:yes gene_type:complete
MEMGYVARFSIQIFILSLVFYSKLSLALTYTLDLSNRNLFNSSISTGLWNSSNQSLHGPLSSNSNVISFGNGSLGNFLDGPAQTGITISGNTITFNTDVRSIYSFLQFQLSSGQTLEVTGSNPLILQVLETTLISGTIQLSGNGGSVNGQTGPFTGGSGFAGGGNGGNGGYGTSPTDTASTSGTTGGGTTAGGTSGTNSNVAVAASGGGGACTSVNTDATDATEGQLGGAGSGNQGNCGGNTSNTVATAFDTNFVGGAGGGGGGACTGTGICNPVSGGAGGGGGGGAIRIQSLGAITLSSGAIIQSSGGNGGNYEPVSSTINCGGGGGGGSGGSIWIQTGTPVIGSGTLSATGGTGGTSTGCAVTNHGGNGSRGVFRIDAPSGGVGSWTLNPGASTAQTSHTAAIANGTYVVYTQAFDFSSSRVVFNHANVTTTGTVTVEFQGSTNGTEFNQTVSLANISLLNNVPYVRAKITLTNAATLTALSIDYDLSDLSDLQIKSGLFCGRIQTNDPYQSFGSILPLLILFLWFGMRISFRRANLKTDSPSY